MPAERDDSYLRDVSPRAAEHRRFAWDGGAFDTARRGHTALVEGTIRSGDHLVMATLRGGAERHEFATDCGYRFDGVDRAGVVSFLPAGCERRLRLRGVGWEWAAITLPAHLLAERRGAALRAFCAPQDPFLFGLLSELERLMTADGGLDVTYCDTMRLAVVRYLERRLDGRAAPQDGLPSKLPPWRIRRIADHVEAHLGGEIRIAALAALVDLSEGHFHRAFRATTGQTPLQFINGRRIQRAMRLLADRQASVVDVALRVGFVSPSHFARAFRGVTGKSPSQYRREL